MKILYITLFFPPTHSEGTENYTLGIAESFMKKGHDVQVVCAEEWEKGEAYWNGVSEDLYKDVPVHRIHLNWTKAHNPNQVLYLSLPVEEWLDLFLGKMKPDVVHVTSAITLGIGALRSVKRAGLPLVLTLTDFWFICPRIQLVRSDNRLCDGKTVAWECQSCLSASSRPFHELNRLLPKSVRPRVWETVAHIPLLTGQRGLRGMLLDVSERKRLLADALTLPDRIFAPSQFLQQIFAQNNPAKIEILRHGHDLSWRNNYQGKTSSPILRIGYIGQICHVKGVHVLIEAFKRAGVAGSARLEIWGDLAKDPEYVLDLKELIGDTSSIVFQGRFARDSLGTVLADLDIIVVPSLWYENAPLVIQEAFATGTPVIATNLGGMAEVITHNSNGLLFERNNVEDLAKHLRRLVAEPDLLVQLQAGIPKVKMIQEEVIELEQLYSEISHQ